MSPKLLALPFLPFLKKAGITAVWASLINSLTGNPLGFLVDKLAGKKVTEKENLNLNNRLLNLKDKQNVPTQQGALRFLGDRSGRLDDAPDIEATNQSVLDNIAKNQSLVLGTTVVPDLNTKQSVVDSFSSLVGIIQQINNNIGAIGQAMLESSVIESKYRQELIDDLEQDLRGLYLILQQDRRIILQLKLVIYQKIYLKLYYYH